jgi:ABC-type phosphate transport system ATPase subunit
VSAFIAGLNGAVVTGNLLKVLAGADGAASFLLGRMVEYAAAVELFTSPRQEQTEVWVSRRFG